MRIMGFWESIAQTIWGDSTRPIRLLLAIVEWTFVSYMLHEYATHQFDYMLKLWTPVVWAACFLIHSGFLLRGLTGRYSKFTMFMESTFGMWLWWITAITHWASQEVPGPTLACAVAMTIVWANYPTHKDAPPEQEAE